MIKLPLEYQEVEYLESNGYQYIDTGLNPTDSWGYKTINTYTVGGGEQCHIGCMDSGNRFVGVYTSGRQNQLSGGWGSFVEYLPDYTWDNTTILTIECNYKNSRKILANGTNLKDLTETISGTISNTIYLFARHYDNSITKTKGKIYYVEITNGYDIIAKYIPCYRKSDGEAGMYEMVEGKFCQNIGTQPFILGKTVNHSIDNNYQQVEYLQSTGIQYINTGFVSTATSEVDVMFGLNSTESGASFNGAIFGGRNSQLNHTFTLFYLASSSPQYFRFDYNAQKTVGSADTITFDTVSKYKFSYLNEIAKTENITTGESTSITITYASTFTTSPIILFAVNTNYGGTSTISPGTYFKGKMYYWRFYEAGTLVADFVPCYRKSDNKTGMYDLVTNTFFENLGTEEFILGSEIKKECFRATYKSTPILPKEYTQISYISSTGYQYIDTGVPFHFSEDTIVLDAELTESKEYQTVYGINERFDGNVQFFGVRQLSTQEKWQGLGVSISYPTFTLNKRFTLQISRVDTTFFQYDGDEKITGSTTSNFTDTTLSGYVFATNNIGNAAFQCIGKIYGFKHKRNGVLMRDLIPCYRNSDNVAGMYDLVTKTFFRSGSSVKFVAGEETTTYKPKLYFPFFPKTNFEANREGILPNEYQALDYIESNGTQYIDTGFKPNPTTTKIETTFALVSGSTQMFGARTIASSTNENNTNVCFGTGTTGQVYVRGDWIRNGANLVTDIEKENFIHLIAHNQTMYIDGIEYTYTETKADNYIDYNFYLFACNTAGNAGFKCKIRQKCFKIWDNGTLVRCMIPCYRKSDNANGMFDTVNQVFYTDVSNTKFNIGNNIENKIPFKTIILPR